jgi:hypothetical protein
MQLPTFDPVGPTFSDRTQACNTIGDAGAQALAALKDSTTLRTLTLDLTCNRIEDAGAHALAMLKSSNTLRHSLDLRGNPVTPCL